MGSKFDIFFEDNSVKTSSKSKNKFDAFFKEEDDDTIIKTSKNKFDVFFDRDEDKDIEPLIKADAYESDAVGIDAWAQDQDRMNDLSSYMISRFGEENGRKKKEESNEDYIKRFITHARKIEGNSIGLMGQIDYLRGADDDERIAFGTVYDEYLKLPSFWEKGGDSSVRAVRDTVGHFLFDPINLFSFGAGRLAASTVGKVAVKEGFKRFIPKSAVIRGGLAGGAVASAETAAFDVGMQDVERKGYVGDARPDDDIDLFQTALASGAGFLLGGALGSLGGLSRGTLSAEELAKKGKLKKANKKASLSNKADELLSKETDIEGYDPNKGASLADATETIKKFQRKKAAEMREKGVQYTPEGMYKDTAFLEPQVLLALNRRMSKVVYNLAQEDPTILTKYKSNVKISDIVQETLEKAAQEGDDGISKDMLDRALRKEGISSKDFLDFMEVNDGFAQMARGTKSEAGATLAVDSPLGKMRKALLDLTPDAKNRLDTLFGRSEETTNAIGSFYNFFKRLDRERRALMVTQIATTARNVATGVSVLGFDTAANIMESSLYHAGKAVRALARGEGSVTGFKKGFDDLFKDSTNLLVLMVNQGKAKEMTDFMLENNPRLAKIIDRTLQEVGEGEGLSGFSRAMNTLNAMQDRVFRRAFFAQAIERKLRRANIGDTAENIYRKADGTVDEDQIKALGLKKDSRIEGLDYIFALDKEIDVAYLKDAVEESLANTFALMPRKGPAHHFIKAIEGLPGVPVIGTGEFPFARFMANAMTFQLKYSPLNAVGASFNYLAKKAFNKGGKITPAENQLMRENFSKGMVGTAALYVAVKYRAENQDTKWYEGINKEGKTIDLRPFFPLAPYLIVADAMVKYANGETDKLSGRDILEGFTGAQFRAGAASYTIDRFYELLGQEGSVTGEQVGETVGTYIGELFGGALTPLRVVKDIQAAFDDEAAIVRDTRQVEGEGGVQRGFDSFLNASFHKNLPAFFGTEKSLPALQSPTRSDYVRRQSPLLGQLLGLRFVERRTPVETELVRLGYENYEIMPSKGDKLVDSLIKRELAPLIEDVLSTVIATPAYEKSSEAEKKNMVKKQLEKFRKYATEIAKERSTYTALVEEQKPFTPFERNEFMRTPRDVRKLADEYFMKHYGETVAESGRYREGKAIGLALAKLYQF